MISRIRLRTIGALTICVVLAFSILGRAPAMAEEIEVSSYGIAENGFPYAIAMAKGFFKEAGADITAIRGSSGGGTTIRNLLAGGMAYGDVSVGAAVSAMLRGTDLKIIAQNSYANDSAWVTMPNSPIKSLQDLKGNRLGYTNPQSNTQAMDSLLLEVLGFTGKDVVMVSTGGFGEGLTMLEHGGVDVMPVGEPLLSKLRGKYKILAWVRDALPPLASDFAVATGKAARERPELIRAILVGRRRAVEFMNAHPDESAGIIAKAYELPVDVIRNVLSNLQINLPAHAKPMWITGRFDFESMNRMVKAQRLIGVIKEEVDWPKMIDESFLPADLRSK